MPSAEIITIGTELLLGEIIDTNSQYLARTLRQAGIDVYHIVTVGDNAQRVANAIQEAFERCDIVITTGGLGPTIDDPTREAVALALHTQLEYTPELWNQIQSRFRQFNRQPTANNKRQAYLPGGCSVVENPVGTAPAFLCETDKNVLISLPGVPAEMEYLMEKAIIPYFRSKYPLKSMIKIRTLHTVGVGESQIDDLITEFEKLSNPTVGLAAHAGQVDIRITAKAEDDLTLNQLIESVETQLRSRLGDWIYGADDDNLETMAVRTIQEHAWSLATFEAGTSGLIARQLSKMGTPFILGQVLSTPPAPDDFLNQVRNFHKQSHIDVTLSVAIYPQTGKFDGIFFIITPQGEQLLNIKYGGPPDNVPRWAFHNSLGTLRGI